MIHISKRFECASHDDDHITRMWCWSDVPYFIMQILQSPGVFIKIIFPDLNCLFVLYVLLVMVCFSLSLSFSFSFPFLPLSLSLFLPPFFSLLSLPLPLLYSTLERKSRRLIAQDGWSPPSFDSSCVRLVLYQDHEGRGKKQIFDTKAHLASLSSQDAPETNVRKLAY